MSVEKKLFWIELHVTIYHLKAKVTGKYDYKMLKSQTTDYPVVPIVKTIIAQPNRNTHIKANLIQAN